MDIWRTVFFVMIIIFLLLLLLSIVISYVSFMAVIWRIKVYNICELRGVHERSQQQACAARAYSVATSIVTTRRSLFQCWSADEQCN